MKFACFSTNYDILNKLISKANEYKKEGDELHCILFKYFYKDNDIEKCRKLPIDKLIIVSNINLMNYDMEGFSNALLECFKKYKYDIILIGNKIEDREVGARFSSKIGAPFIVNCINFKIDSNKFYAEKGVYGGILVISLETNLPVIISFDNLDTYAKESDSIAAIEEIKTSIIHSRIIIRDKTRLSARFFDLTKANKFVCIGENIHEEKELKKVDQISKLLKAELVGDKSIFSRNWLKEWLGSSNLKVKSELLLELGVNGDLDHIAGILDSKLIIAINEDPDSLIFNYSDYYAIADIHKLIPKLVKRLNKIK